MKGWTPSLAAAAFLLLPLALIEPRTYVTLTVAGLAMGMLIFLVASGLTLIFGLMDVLNFAHGALFSWGAYVGYSVVVALDGRWGWAASPSLTLNLLLLLLAIVAATLVAVGLGIILERVIVRPVYGKHMFQILITLGATIVLEELLRIVWGPNDQVMPLPGTFQGSWDVADVIILRFPVVAIVLGALVYAAMLLVLTRTKVGLIVRAGVESGEMIQVMMAGATQIILERFTPDGVLQAIQDHQVTVFPGVPTMFNYLVNFPDHAKYDLVHVLNELMDAFRVSESVVERIVAAFMGVPASRFLRVKRSISLLVSNAEGDGKGRIVQGRYQSPILIQWKRADTQVRRLDVTITRFK